MVLKLSEFQQPSRAFSFFNLFKRGYYTQIMKDAGKTITLTVAEVEDPKNKDKIAHRSCSPNYGKDEKGNKILIGYHFSNWTESYLKLKREETKKKNKE